MATAVLAIGGGLLALIAAVLIGLAISNGLLAWRAERLVPPAGRFITIDGVRLHFTDEGNGPAILMLHGLASQLQTFTYAVNERLAADYRVITVDRPGSGYSKPGRDGSAEAQVALFAGLLRALGIDRALVVGHSLGGALALAMAHHVPDRVAGLALIAPVTRAQRDVPRALQGFALRTDAMRWLIGWTIAAPIANLKRRDILTGLFAPDPVPADFAIRGGAVLTARPWTFRGAARDLAEIGGRLRELAPRFEALRLPLHILYGRGDRILDHRVHGEHLRDQIPGSTLVLIDGGHMTPLAAPDQTATFIEAAARAAGLEPARTAGDARRAPTGKETQAMSAVDTKTGERRVWRLRRRPQGKVRDGDLEFTREPLPPLQEGLFQLETIYLSLDPTNRIWMSDMEQYMPPVALDAPMRGVVCGRVVASRKSGVGEGELWFGLGEWADQLVTDGSGLTKASLPPGLPLSTGFGVFGLVGPTAYFGLLDIGQPKPGDVLVVSAAYGGVGQIVGQIGKIKGCRVIGIAGGPEKCRMLVEELGFDAAIDYKNEDVGERLDALAPEGVDINFEQVGGSIMEAVMARMKLHGRMPLCGLISGYNDEQSAQGPTTWPLILMHRLKVQGFIVLDYMPRMAEMAAELGPWLAEGRVKTRQDVRVGLEHAVEYLDLLYTGGNKGKLLVEVHPDAGTL